VNLNVVVWWSRKISGDCWVGLAGSWGYERVERFDGEENWLSGELMEVRGMRWKRLWFERGDFRSQNFLCERKPKIRVKIGPISCETMAMKQKIMKLENTQLYLSNRMFGCAGTIDWDYFGIESGEHFKTRMWETLLLCFWLYER
jgi:hypothetical protein